MIQIEGRNPIREALRARRVKRIFVAKEVKESGIKDILDAAARQNLPIIRLTKQELVQRAHTEGHQGIIAEAEPIRTLSLKEWLAKLNGRDDAVVLVLDEITDPRNLGSLLRTADAAGVAGCIIPERRGVGITAVVEKASAGAAQYVPVIEVPNIVGALDQLKQARFWVYGADAEAPIHLYSGLDFSGRVALVIGAEGKGLRRLVKEHCDLLVSIPMRGKIQSLNAGVAGALFMYEVLRSRL
ncbi:MAG: 23S rRNA (guanosine(2251)-2'-O)-methyltransferase RlmB [Firmicutes bacterium]|nr:23S rRNA (guanosine(2251)-2'-O)-methyltransferase RlmB [Bacillota bacterium]